MSTFREQVVEAQAEEWAERHRAVGRHAEDRDILGIAPGDPITLEQIVTLAIDFTPYAAAALDAVRDALTSDDPQVVGAMAERVGLHEERATAPVWEQCDRQDCSQWGAGIIVPGDEPPTPHAHGAARWVIKARLTTPWREVPDAD